MNEYKFQDIEIGLKKFFNVSITEEMLENFSDITGDKNPLHTDIEYAKSKGFNEKVVFGMLTASFLSRLVGMYLPGKYAMIHSVDILFKKPIFVTSSPLTIIGTVIEIAEIFKQITIAFEILDNKNQKVVRGKIKVGIMDE